MDAQEIRALLGKSIFERAQKYRKRILQSSCTTNEDGVRHLTALVQGSGPDHARVFRAEIRLAGEILGEGQGTSKKSAEHSAAEAAFEVLQDRFGDQVADA